MNHEPIKELVLKAPDGREKRMLAFLPEEKYEQNFREAAARKGLTVVEMKSLPPSLPTVANGGLLPFVGPQPHSVATLKTPVAQREGGYPKRLND